MTADPRDSIVHEDRPWGWFKQLAHNTECTVKVIRVEAGQSLSLQYHHDRDEMWMALDDGLIFEIDGVETASSEGQAFFVPRGTTHRVTADEHAGRFLEVAYGTFDETDIVRLDDRYGRS